MRVLSFIVSMLVVFMLMVARKDEGPTIEGVCLTLLQQLLQE